MRFQQAFQGGETGESREVKISARGRPMEKIPSEDYNGEDG